MNTQFIFNPLIPVAVAASLLGACSTPPTKPEGADAVRGKLSQLQSDAQLADRAPIAIKEAELAVSMAEEPRTDPELGQHLVRIADRKVAVADAQAKTSLEGDLHKMLNDQQVSARLDANRREADRGDRRDLPAARTDAILPDTQAAKLQTDELQKQLTELNAKSTDRGFLVTFGDASFVTGQSTLKGGAANTLNKLVAFLDKYPDRIVVIEGHTDNVGGNALNQWLSERRADSVKSYLMNEGISFTRLTASGKGEGSPIAGNDSVDGRRQNRRVEVIIADTAPSATDVSLR